MLFCPVFSLTFSLTFGQFLANFERLVLGWIEADFCNQILILQQFSSSTRFTDFCTAPNSKIQLNFLKHFRIFSVLFQNCCTFFANFVKNSPTLMKFSRNFSIFQEKLPKSPRISDFRRFCKAYYRKFHKTIFKKLEKKVRVRPKIRSNSRLD